MRNREWKPVALAATAALLMAACASGDEDVARIEHADGSRDVVVQVGDYLPIGYPDEFVLGPQVVIYGDGSAFVDVFEPTDGGLVALRQYEAQLNEDQIQQILRDASDLPATSVVSRGSAPVDGVVSRLRVNGQVWTIHRYDVLSGIVPDLEDYDEGARASVAEGVPFAEFVAAVRDVIREGETGPWNPILWVEREFSDELCSVVSSSDPLSGYSAPIFPHLEEAVANAARASDCALLVAGA